MLSGITKNAVDLSGMSSKELPYLKKVTSAYAPFGAKGEIIHIWPLIYGLFLKCYIINWGITCFQHGRGSEPKSEGDLLFIVPFAF